ncbi:MAG TPA: right-handed parallel beta-helix repeat-containing protein [Anaerolineae bacterium]
MKRNRLVAAATAVLLMILAAFPARTLGAVDSRSYGYQWTEGKLTTAEFWNDPSRIGCEYAQNPWPAGAFAAERTYVNAARIALRDGLKVTDLINSLGRKGTARVHGAEANCPNQHHDYPPHFHVFYMYVDGSGAWKEVNSHAYPNVQGKITGNFVIPQICGGGSSYNLTANQWLDMKDETCTALWQQRFTSAGDYEIRRNAAGPTYTLRARSVNSDLASVDVLENGKLRWNITTTEYTGTGLRLVARETDFNTNVVTMETWQGDLASFNMLSRHTTSTTSAAPAPAPAPTQAPPASGQPAPAAPPAPVAATSKTITARVAAFDDDGFQDGGTWTNDTSSLWVGDNRDVNNSYAGIRFSGVTVPKGATIQSATLRLCSVAASSARMTVNVYGEASGNSAKLSSASLPGARARTAAFTTVTNPGPWGTNSWYAIDVSKIVKEIVGRPDWAQGNALSLLLKGSSGSQGARRAVHSNTSWDSSLVPQLEITYATSDTAAPKPAPAPTALPTPAPVPPPGEIAPTPQPASIQTGSKVFFVAPTGSDGNAGSQSSPWRTIAKAANTATAGATVYIMGGTYNEQLRPANAGTAGAWITFAAYPGQTVILDGSGLNLGNWSGLVDVSNRAYIKVSGLTVRNSSYAGLFASAAQHIVFQGNHTLHSQASGIGVWSSVDVVADGNDVEDSNYNGGNEAVSFGGTGPFEIKNNKVHNPSASSTTTLKEGIDAKQGSHDGTIHHNEVSQTQHVALYVDAYDQHTYNIQVYANRVHDVRMGITLASEAGGLLENVSVYNNVVWNSYYAGIRTFGLVDTASHPMQNITYANNTVYQSGTGINVSNNQISNFKVVNNIVSQNGINLELGSGVSVSQSNNLFDGATGGKTAADLAGSAQFNNPAGADFHVGAGSPAINHGTSNGAPATDADGVARPQGGAYDIGAYER